MKKMVFLLVGVLLLTSWGLCGKAKLNVWVRDQNFDVLDRTGYLKVYNCQGREVLSQPFRGGHIEVDLVPGCYIVRAVYACGNYFTDRVGIIAKCGEETCVNLIMPRFRFIVVPHFREPQPLGPYYCSTAILPPLLVNAAQAGINVEDVHRAIDVLARAANMDRNVMLDAVRAEVKVLEENLQQLNEQEQKEVKEVLVLMEKMRVKK